MVGSLLLIACAFAQTAEIELRGIVRDGRGGEGLARVIVQLSGQAAGTSAVQKTQTGADGRFVFLAVPSGSYELRADSVDFRPVIQKLELNQSKEVEILLMPQWLRETVDVKADAFDIAGQATPGNTLELNGRELQNLSSLIIADPIRSMQSLPGVASNDDFRSQFSVHGASFGRTGIVVDDVLLHAPFHAVGSDSNSVSATSFPGEILQSMTLHPGPPPVQFGDRSAAVLDARTRGGDEQRIRARLMFSASNASGQVEGPLSKGRGSWLIGARKSYLQYIVQRTAPDNTLAFAFTDAQGRFSYRIAPRHQLALTVLAGGSGLDRTNVNRNFGPNTLVESNDQQQMATLALHSSFRRLVATQRTAWIRETVLSLNRDRRELGQAFYGEWTAQSNQTWQWSDNGSLDFGGSLRRIRENGFFLQTLFLPATFLRSDPFRGSALRSGAYVRQNLQSKTLQASIALRFDHSDVNGVASASPQASLAWQATGTTRMTLQWGQSAQYPEVLQARSSFVRGRLLLPERATQYAMTLEQRLGQRTRIRVEGYVRHDRDLLAIPGLETRVFSGVIRPPVVAAGWLNSQRGTARFMTASLQRRTANRFEGWVTYTYGKAETRDGVLGQSFASDFDQRHAVVVYGSYRMRASVNLSGRYSYGSGFPVPGYFRGLSLRQAFIGSQRNELRFPDYQRWDVRLNKSFRARGLQWTLFVEAVNLTNRDNVRFDDYGGFNSRTGQAVIRTSTMLPLLPTAGLAVAW